MKRLLSKPQNYHRYGVQYLTVSRQFNKVNVSLREKPLLFLSMTLGQHHFGADDFGRNDR